MPLPTRTFQHRTSSVLAVLLIFFSLISFTTEQNESAKKKQYVIVDQPSVPKEEKEALLILPGLGASKEGVKDIARYFAHKGYDLYIPDYIRRDSIGECVKALDEFITKNELSRYRKLHVFSFIIGSWTLNRWLKDHRPANLTTIIYDRSPLQERAPYALVKEMPRIIRFLQGDVIRELSETPYTPIQNDSVHIGILLESRATPMIRRMKETAMELGPVDWTVKGRGQDCDDSLFTVNNHDDMYHEFGELGPEIFHYISHGKFSGDAPRKRPDIDPFEKKRPKGVK